MEVWGERNRGRAGENEEDREVVGVKLQN